MNIKKDYIAKISFVALLLTMTSALFYVPPEKGLSKKKDIGSYYIISEYKDNVLISNIRIEKKDKLIIKVNGEEIKI